jgi:hypothetical protein
MNYQMMRARGALQEVEDSDWSAPVTQQQMDTEMHRTAVPPQPIVKSTQVVRANDYAQYAKGGMFFYVVEEGQRVLMRHPNGTLSVVVGPKRVWRGWRMFRPMQHVIAGPGQFLIVRYRDGRQEHLEGPQEVWLDPRVHLEIATEDALQLAHKEAVVVYGRPEGADSVSRRIVYGPTMFVPQPGEWLHMFSWHGSAGGSRGMQKVAHGLVFQKLWLMPDQMYHNIPQVRTADDAVLTIFLMIFFELLDIEGMLDSTHDPIGDFLNAATSDVVDFTGKHDFESFKRQTSRLNDLDTYAQLTSRAAKCGYRINKVVFRGYGASDALQKMHDQAIQARTQLQLQRATEQQAQELENFKLESKLARDTKVRAELSADVDHELALSKRRQDAELRQREIERSFALETRRREAESELEVQERRQTQQHTHLNALRQLGVDLTSYLTQSRADRVIELRGDGRPHIHLDGISGEGEKAESS